MKSPSFDTKVTEIIQTDPRYRQDAYEFMVDAVSFSVERLPARRHVSAGELLEGIRDYSFQEFGVLADEVLTSWGIRSASDVGEIVYQLIEAKLLSASPEDRPEDFQIDFPLIARRETAISLKKMPCKPPIIC